MRLRATGIACLLIAVAAQTASAQQSALVSLDRVRAALLKPPSKLYVEYRQPDFSIRIQERRPLDDLFEIPLWDTPPVMRTTPSTLAHIEGTPGPTPALIQTTVDPGGLARSATNKAKAHATRSQMDRAIAKYCAAQPDAGSSIPLCWAYGSP